MVYGSKVIHFQLKNNFVKKNIQLNDFKSCTIIKKYHLKPSWDKFSI